MLQARRNFITTYDGDEVRIKAGISRVSEDSELAQRFPDHFEPVPGPEGARRGGREAVSATFVDRVVTTPVEARDVYLYTVGQGRSTSTPAPEPLPSYEQLQSKRRSWRLRQPAPPRREVELKAEYGQLEVTLRDRAKQDIVRAALDAGAVEVGGVLAGPQRIVSYAPVRVTEATMPGPQARCEVGFYQSDPEHDLQQVQRSGYELGGWHVHHVTDEISRDLAELPSDSDLTRWTGLRQLLGARFYIGLLAVVTEARAVELSAWSVRDSHIRNRDRVERARVVLA